jgi:hypothetical protein
MLQHLSLRQIKSHLPLLLVTLPMLSSDAVSQRLLHSLL